MTVKQFEHFVLWNVFFKYILIKYDYEACDKNISIGMYTYTYLH